MRESESASKIRQTVSRSLRFVETISDLTNPEFLALCSRVGLMSEQSDVMAEFELDEDTSLGWFQAAARQGEETRSIYCTVNALAHLALDATEVEETPAITLMIESMLLYLSAFALVHRNEFPRALAMLEGYLEIGPSSYEDPRFAENLSKRLSGLTNGTYVRIIDLLAVSLARLGRDGHERALLEAFLGLHQVPDHDPEVLSRHLEEWWAAQVEHCECEEPEIRDLVLHGDFGFASIVANIIANLAWCMQRTGDLERGLALFSAYLGVRPDSLAGLETLQRRFEELGIDDVLTTLRRWAALVSESGKLDALATTFKREFTVPSARLAPLEQRPVVAERWFTRDATAAALVFCTLMSRLLDDRPDAVIDLFVSCAGISPSDFEEGPDERATFWLRSVDVAIADRIVIFLSLPMFQKGEMAQILNLYEAYFGVSNGGYFDPDRLRARVSGRAKGGMKQKGLEVMLATFWAVCLVFRERMIEAAAILEALYPAIMRRPLGDLDSFDLDLMELPPLLAAILVNTAAKVLAFSGRTDESRCLLQRCLGIDEADFTGNLVALRTRLFDRRLCRFANDDLSRVVHALAETLLLDGRPEHAIALVQAFLGFDDPEYRDQEELCRKTAEAISGRQGSFVAVLAIAHVAAATSTRSDSQSAGPSPSERSRHFGLALGLLEAMLGRDNSIDLGDLELSRAAWAKLTPQTEYSFAAGDLVITLLESLKGTGRFAEYHRLLASLESEDAWIDLAPQSLHFHSIALHLIEWRRDGDSARSLRLCGKIVAELRNWTTRGDLAALDRLLLVSRGAELRRRIVTLGHSLIFQEREATRSDELRRKFLCWDAELGDRLLLQRFLYAAPDPGDEEAAGFARLPVDANIAFAESASIDRLPLGCLGKRGEAVPAVVTEERPLSLPSMAMIRPEFEAALREGIDEARLAEVLGSRLLLRVGFADCGALVWTLFGAEDAQLRIVARGQTASGQDVRGSIHAAVRRHDAAIDNAWERLRFGEAWRDQLSLQVSAIQDRCENPQGSGLAAAAQRLDQILQESRLTSFRERLRSRFPRLYSTSDFARRRDNRPIGIAFGRVSPKSDWTSRDFEMFWTRRRRTSWMR